MANALPFPHLDSISSRFAYDQFDDFIGEGKFGNVYAAFDESTQTRVALKVVDKSKLESQKALTDIINEVELSRKVVRHPNCVSVLDAFQTDDKILIVQELIEGSDLQVLVAQQQRGGGLPENLVRSIAAQLVFAISSLHKAAIVHRDVKPENLMLSGEAIPIIGDDSRVFDSTLTAQQYLEAARLTLVDFGLAKSLPKSTNNGNNNNNNQSASTTKAMPPRRQIAPLNVSSAAAMSAAMSILPGLPPMGGQQQGSTASTGMDSSAPSTSVAHVGSPIVSSPNTNSNATFGASASVGGINSNNNAISNAFGLFPLVSNIDAATPSQQSAASTTNNGASSSATVQKFRPSGDGSAGPPSPHFTISSATNHTHQPHQQQPQHQNHHDSSTGNGNGSGTGLTLPRQASVQSLDRTNSPMVMTPCGTFGFSAPELMRHLAAMGVGQKQQTSRQEVYKRDIYSVGLVLFYAFSGRTPFNVKTAAALAKQMENGPVFPAGSVWDRVSADAKSFIQMLLAAQPDARPTAEVAMMHPWIAELCVAHKTATGFTSTHATNATTNNNNNSNNNVVSPAAAASSASVTTSSSSPTSGLLQHASSSNNSNNLLNTHNPAASGSGSLMLSSGLRRKGNGRSFEDLAALHEIRGQCAEEFDAICSAQQGDDDSESVPRVRPAHSNQQQQQQQQTVTASINNKEVVVVVGDSELRQD